MDILLTCPPSWPSGLSPPPGEAGGTAAASQCPLWATASQQQVQGQGPAFAGLIDQLLQLAGQGQEPQGCPSAGAHGWFYVLKPPSELPPESTATKGKQGPQDTLETEEGLLAWAWQGVLLHMANGWNLRPMMAHGQGSGQSSEGHIQAVGQMGQLIPTEGASTPAQVASANPAQPAALVGAGLGLSVAGVSRPKAQAGEPSDGLALQGAAGVALADLAEGTDLVRLSSSAPTDGHPAGATGEPSAGALGLPQIQDRGNPEIQSQAQSAKFAKGGVASNHVRVVTARPSHADAGPANTDDRPGLMGLQQATREVIGESGELSAAEPGSDLVPTAAGAAQEVDQPEGMTREPEGYAPMAPMPTETPFAAMPATEGQSASRGSPGNGAPALVADSQRGGWAQQQEPAESRPADGYPPIGSGSPASFEARTVEVAEADEAAQPGERFAIELVSRLAGDLGRLAILGRDRAVLQLYPPELGQMNVRLSLGGEGLTVHMVVQNAEVRAIVESSLSQLQSALADQGLQAAALYVQVGQEPDQRPRAWLPQRQPAGRRRPDPSSPQTEAVATPRAITALRSQYSTLEYWI